MVILLVMRERLTGRSHWSSFVTAILSVVRGGVGNDRRSPSSFAVQLFFQTINLLLYGFGVLFMREMATTSRMAFAGVGSTHAPLPVPSMFEVNKMVLLLGSPRFCLVWIWTYHSWKPNSLTLQDFPRTAPIVRTKFGTQPKIEWSEAQKAQNNEFIESGL